MQSGTFRIHRSVTKLIFKWSNFKLDSAPSILLAGDSSYTIKAAVRYGGVTYPISFDSGRVGTVPVDGTLSSLPLNIAVSGGNDIELRWKISYQSAPTHWPCTTRYSTDGWNFFGNSVTDECDTANIYYTRQTSFMVLPPYQITGDASVLKAVEIMGDSISSDGSGDNFLYNTGFMQRGFASAGIPFTNNGASGNSLAYQLVSWGSPEAAKVRRRTTRGDGAISHVFCGLCTNDFSSNRTNTDILSDLAALKSQLDPLGIKLIPMTCFPRTNPGNTAKNDSDSANVWAYRRNLNASLRSQNGVGYGLIDAAAIAQNPGNIDLWRSDLGTPTGDGIHPNAVIHDALATYFAQQAAIVTGIWTS